MLECFQVRGAYIDLVFMKAWIFSSTRVAKTKVTMGTPVRATDGGKILRADANFQDMTYSQFNRVMSECYREHRTSDRNEDLFRGCQVWIGHGKWTHDALRAFELKINPVIKKEQPISRGDLIAFVGVSGTGPKFAGQKRNTLICILKFGWTENI